MISAGRVYSLERSRKGKGSILISLTVLILALASAADEIVGIHDLASDWVLSTYLQSRAVTTIALPMPSPIDCDLTVKSESHDKMYVPALLSSIALSPYNTSYSGKTSIFIASYSIIAS